MSGEDEYYKHARLEMFPKMKSSALSIWIVPKEDEPDAKSCLELGAAIMFDKPIIVFVPNGRKVPVNLRRVASVILQGDPGDPDMQQKLEHAIKQILEQDARVPKS